MGHDGCIREGRERKRGGGRERGVPGISGPVFALLSQRH